MLIYIGNAILAWFSLQNNLIRIDETKFKKHIHSADDNPLVQFTAMMMRMNANIR